MEPSPKYEKAPSLSKMGKKAAKEKEEKEHRIRLNDPELAEIVGSLEHSKSSGKGNLQLIETLISRLSHPRAGGNYHRAL